MTLSKIPEYRTWQNMMARCTKPSTPHYHRYGGRGIRICQDWMDSFQAFLTYIGPRPSLDHSLDRIDSNGHYEPGNVRWATRSVQQNNKTSNHRVILRGAELTIAQAVAVSGNRVTYDLARCRLRRGWSVERAFETSPFPVGAGRWLAKQLHRSDAEG